MGGFDSNLGVVGRVLAEGEEWRGGSGWGVGVVFGNIDEKEVLSL